MSTEVTHGYVFDSSSLGTQSSLAARLYEEQDAEQWVRVVVES